jgi:hypothetical protein
MKKISAILMVPLIALAGCSEPTNSKSSQERENDSLKSVALEPAKDYREKAYYPIPSPEQMFGFINDAGVNYSKDLIQDPSMAE